MFLRRGKLLINHDTCQAISNQALKDDAIVGLLKDRLASIDGYRYQSNLLVVGRPSMAA